MISSQKMNNVEYRKIKMVTLFGLYQKSCIKTNGLTFLFKKLCIDTNIVDKPLLSDNIISFELVFLYMLMAFEVRMVPQVNVWMLE